jgi:hypothetical protein
MWLHITTRRILLSEVLQAKSVNLGTRQHHVHPAHVARIIDKSTSGGPAPAAPAPALLGPALPPSLTPCDSDVVFSARVP